MTDPIKAGERYHAQKNVYKKFLDRVHIKKAIPALEELSANAYARHDCLACAACCKNYSPRFKAPDIKRISKYLGLKESDMIAQYLHRDEEGDHVLNTKPCTFLNKDNTCSIYDVRPSDCSRFPYVDEDVFLKRKSLTLKNVSFCPIAQDALEEMMKRML